jgi:DNA-binding protein YbaB
MTTIKKTFFIMLACIGLSVLMSACIGAGAGVSASVDPKVLENKEEVLKIYDAIMKSMGDQASKAHEVRIHIDNPADKGRTGSSYLYLTMDMQDPNKPKQLIRQMFHGELGYWMTPEEVTVQVRGRGNKEDFRLEDELFDFTKIDAEKLYNLIQTAYNLEKDDAGKYTYRYVQYVTIDMNGINIDVVGKLEANDQIISKCVYFDLDGKMKK